jgi:hypothetical protein
MELGWLGGCPKPAAGCKPRLNKWNAVGIGIGKQITTAKYAKYAKGNYILELFEYFAWFAVQSVSHRERQRRGIDVEHPFTK